MTIKDIKEGNFVEPYCFRDDRDKEWYDIGLLHGVEIAEKELIEKACEIFNQYLVNTYVVPSAMKSQQMSDTIDIEEMHRVQYINNLVYKFRKTMEG